MKRMQAIQPKMAELKEKHKNNPQKLNQEMMEFYKKNNINPLAGCLPMFIQMPIFIGLYQVLWRSVSLKGAKFLWIKDLSEPDRIYVFSQKLPIIGNELNVLPVLMIIVMIIQQRITAKNMVVTDPSQIAQQKMMAYMFPVMLFIFFYKLASGLTLYFTVLYIMMTLAQLQMSKINKAV